MLISEIYQKFLQFRNVSTDSRNIPENCIFFALKGDKFDGNQFVNQAFENGAKYAVISDKKYFVEGKTFLVDDTLIVLQKLANFHRKQLKTKIFSITGSNGKTTTKELIFRVLSKKFKTQATQGNYNNHIGVPLTLLGLNENDEFAVVEMGANHIGEIAELCQIAEPDFGLITNIGRAHLEGFGSLQNLINTKIALFEFVKNNNGTFFLNKNDKNLISNISQYSNNIEFGESEKSIVKCKKVYDGIFVKLSVEINNTLFEISTKMVGTYNIDNILGAIAVGIENGISEKDIVDAIESYEPSNNRSQLLKTEKNTLILDMYNANPTSMHLSIENFSKLNIENKMLIIGDMLELGENEKNEHQNIIDFVLDCNFSYVFLVGKIFGSCNNSKRYLSFDNVNELIEFLKINPVKDRTILLKASNGTGLKKCVEFL